MAPHHSFSDLDQIELAGLRVNCLVGIYPYERIHKQSLVVDLVMELDTRGSGRTLNLSQTVDYAAIENEIRFILEECRFPLLETAADVICAYLLAPPQACQRRAQIQRCKVRLAKPQAFAHDGAPCPALTIWRSAAEYGHSISASSASSSSLSLFRSANLMVEIWTLTSGGQVSLASDRFLEPWRCALLPLASGLSMKPGNRHLPSHRSHQTLTTHKALENSLDHDVACLAVTVCEGAQKHAEPPVGATLFPHGASAILQSN